MRTGPLFYLLLILLLTLVADVWTKTWAEQALVWHESVPLVGQVLRLTLGYNTGVIFGLFAQYGSWLVVSSSLAIGILGLWLVGALHTGSLPPVAAWPGGLLLGGALGNVVDRRRDGRITDFLDMGLGTLRWPTFNLADSCIVMGLVLLIWLYPSTIHTREA